MFIIKINYQVKGSDDYITKESIKDHLNDAIDKLSEYRQILSRLDTDVAFLWLEDSKSKKRLYLYTPFGEKINSPAILETVRAN